MAGGWVLVAVWAWCTQKTLGFLQESNAAHSGPVPAILLAALFPSTDLHSRPITSTFKVTGG